MVHYQAIKNTKTFCINQKITFGADLGAYFLCVLYWNEFSKLIPDEKPLVMLC